MPIEEASCVFRGTTFTGTVDVTEDGPNTAVHVRYKDQDLSATTGGLPVEAVAQTLLKNLVEWEGDRIVAPTPPRRSDKGSAE